MGLASLARLLTYLVRAAGPGSLRKMYLWLRAGGQGWGAGRSWGRGAAASPESATPPSVNLLLPPLNHGHTLILAWQDSRGAVHTVGAQKTERVEGSSRSPGEAELELCCVILVGSLSLPEPQFPHLSSGDTWESLRAKCLGLCLEYSKHSINRNR